MRFVEKNGSFKVEVGGRSGTPVLEMPNISQGNKLKITAIFQAKTNGTANGGFSYQIKPINDSDAVAISASESTVQGNAGWQTTTKVVFFEAKVAQNTPVEDVDFEVNFVSGGLDGSGEIQDFLLIGEVISLLNP